MAKSSDLLRDLQDFLSFEEEIISDISAFYLKFNWRETIKPEYHKEVEEGLVTLRDESLKHANMIKEMIAYVASSGKDEF